MTNPTQTERPPSRRLTCSACGSEFGCDLTGNCWCMDEPVKLPMPKEGEAEGADCLCRDCLRKAAAAAR